jgi:hypothetical protein
MEGKVVGGGYNGLASIATRSRQKLIEVFLAGSFVTVEISEYIKKHTSGAYMRVQSEI